ncbi:MAG: GntR family transcriptional regulator [Proteobacteria bacterium]|nr:GntR family transcriptional regulator [Pseudomonadota bacterium]
MSGRVVTLKTKPRARPRRTGGGGRSGAPAARTIADIVEALRTRIGRQDVAPGAKLGEQELAAEFGVPRARIREVFGVLESRGLIERIPNRGAVVSRLELEHVFQLYEVRAVLEGMCVRLATQNAPPETWDEFVHLFGAPMDGFVKAGDFDSFIVVYERFRRAIIEWARNPVAARMLDSIYEKTNVVIRRIVILPGRAQSGLGEHRAVVAAMRAGNAEEAERLKRMNLQNAQDTLRRFQKYVL